MPYSFIDASQKLTHMEDYDLPSLPDNDVVVYPVEFNIGESSNKYKSRTREIIKGIENNFNFLQQDNVRFVIFDLFESSYGLENACHKIQSALDKELYVVSCDQILPSKSTDKIKFFYNNHWIHRMPPSIGTIRYTPKKLYINLTRVMRYHRAMLLDELIERDLFQHGYNTLSNLGSLVDNYIADNPQTKIGQQKFNTLDVQDLEKENPNHSVPYDACQKSFVYIATETLVDNSRMFFSEKVYKPIAIGMPFMVLGNPGTLEILKNTGYKTFDKWFNEDYDKDIGIKDRVKIIVDNIEYYKNFDAQQLKNLRYQTKDICRHNLKLYKQQKQKHDIIKIMEEICQL